MTSQSLDLGKAARLRWAVALDLGLFNASMFALALVPSSTLILPEWIVLAMSTVCAVGVITHASARLRLPGEQWSALGTAWLGTVTLAGYLTTADAPATYEVAIPLFLLAGTASGYAAHLVDGGTHRPRRDG